MTKEIVLIILVPVILIIPGLLFLLFQPKDIGNVYGYRTRLASLSKYTWKYANRKSGQLFLVFGSIIFLVNLSTYLFCLRVEDIEQLLSVISVASMIISIMGIVIIVEYKLRKKFDSKGNPK